MNEAYLHYIWKTKRLPFHQIKTTDGELVEFISVGVYNEFESGPDFSMAKVRMNNLTWVGSIEIHVKSSDWYRHKHHLDNAFSNVILHVVYCHDKAVEINSRSLPVVELKNHIDVNHFLKFNNFTSIRKNMFSCKKLFDEQSLIELEKMKYKAIQDRLFRKTSEQQFYAVESESLLLLKLTAKSFGSSVNGQPFEQIANSFSLDELKNSDEKFKSNLLTDFLWKRKGLFSASHPEKRIEQFLLFIKNYDFDFPFWELPPSMIIIYFDKQFSLCNIKSSFLVSNFLVNCISRFLFWKGKKQQNPDLIKKSIQLLNLIKPESNNLTKKWRELKIYPKNAFDSQALSEIYEQLCMRKACIDCKIGLKILST